MQTVIEEEEEDEAALLLEAQSVQVADPVATSGWKTTLSRCSGYYARR